MRSKSNTKRANLAKNVQLSQNEEAYDPFENQNPNGTRAGGALAHFLTALLGTGILAMPMAFKNSV